jgi:hypothetical protein
MACDTDKLRMFKVSVHVQVQCLRLVYGECTFTLCILLSHSDLVGAIFKVQQVFFSDKIAQEQRWYAQTLF